MINKNSTMHLSVRLFVSSLLTKDGRRKTKTTVYSTYSTLPIDTILCILQTPHCAGLKKIIIENRTWLHTALQKSTTPFTIIIICMTSSQIPTSFLFSVVTTTIHDKLLVYQCGVDEAAATAVRSLYHREFTVVLSFPKQKIEKHETHNLSECASESVWCLWTMPPS